EASVAAGAGASVRAMTCAALLRASVPPGVAAAGRAVASRVASGLSSSTAASSAAPAPASASGACSRGRAVGLVGGGGAVRGGAAMRPGAAVGSGSGARNGCSVRGRTSVPAAVVHRVVLGAGRPRGAGFIEDAPGGLLLEMRAQEVGDDRQAV